ncbi:MAG TPA: magnesium transporter, partial [Polyangiaceae bacterium]|nr:magnesium transporter [Polyangiaceae bacterium]
MRLGPLLGPDIKQILEEDPDQVRQLIEELQVHPEDIADILAELDPETATKVLTTLPADEAAPIFERLEEHEQEEFATQMTAESVARIASEMEPDDRADLFSTLPEEIGEKVFRNLERVDAEAAEEVREIEKYPDTAAGHLMTTKWVSVPPTVTVAGALDAVRAFVAENPDSPVYNVYIMSKDERMMGLASLRELVASDPTTRVIDMARTNVISVPPDMDQEEVARRMAKYDLAAMPVLDSAGKLLGVITIDDIIDVLTQEQTEDVQKIGGVEPLDVPYFQTSFVEFIKKRGVWLVILFVEEFFTQTALRYYDPVFEAVKGASYYVPLLISTGGNSGSQSSTLIIRGLAIGEIRPRDWWRIAAREAAMGLVLGAILGTIGFFRVLMYRDQHVDFALTVACTLVGIVMTGCTVGSMLPLGLKRL